LGFVLLFGFCWIAFWSVGCWDVCVLSVEILGAWVLAIS